MISNELLGMTLVFIAVFAMCLIGYIVEYIKYVTRFYRTYGRSVFRRGIRYLKRL